MKQSVGGWLLAALMLATGGPTQAQTSVETLPTGNEIEVAVGLAVPFLFSGQELSRSQTLRDNGQSYFADASGNRRATGAYGNPIGWSIAFGAYKPLRNVPNLLLGGVVRSSLTGTQPADGGYEEGYYFNYISFGGGAKYYLAPAARMLRKGFYVRGDAGLGTVLTKNRYLNTAGEQEFFHQFGIGWNATGGIGYVLPIGSRGVALDFQVLYGQYGTRVEVNGIGNDTWSFGSVIVLVGLRL